MVRLRGFHEGDLAALVYHANNPNVARYLRERFPSPFTDADGIWWINEGHRLGKALNLAVEFDQQLVGCIGANFFDDERRCSAEIGYWIGEDFWYKGIASQAVEQLTRELLTRDDIIRLFAPVAHPNVGSMRVLEKCGFQREAVLRKAMSLRGNVYDEHIFAKLKT